ncbi:S24 family peptidase [Pseudomonas sp. LFM046]|uniref:S24 family peptidase n=1 Tax=Pseudomonas sp. LFM046 TaxID=1608357 RepID=UPI0005CFDA27|nr:S24 family peptidase [Pseudomonas sp. LFM046]
MKTTDRITKLVLARKPNLGARNVKRDIADTCKVSYEAVRRWYAGETENIKNENLIALAEGYDTTVDWLLSGKGEPPRRNGNPRETASPVDLTRKVLEKYGKGLTEETRRKIVNAIEETRSANYSGEPATCSDANASAGDLLISPYDLSTDGHGQAPSDYSELVRTITVSAQQLERLGIDYSSPANLSVITAWGQSMEGTINDKDLVLVDRGIREYVGDGIYLVSWAGHLFIRRLQLAAKDQVELIADNPAHKARVVPMSEILIHAKALLGWGTFRL